MRVSGFKLSVVLSVALGLVTGTPLLAQAYVGAPALSDTGGLPQAVGGTSLSAFRTYFSEVPELTRALAAIKARHYSEAAFVLQDIAPSSGNPDTKFLAGLANAGVGRLPLAKRYFRQAARLGYSFVDTQVALAIVNLHLNDRTGVEGQLKYLERRQSLCETRCADATKLDQAVTAVRGVLSRS